MITVEGYTIEGLLSLDRVEFEALIFTSAPIVFHVGSATVLAEFTRDRTLLKVRLAHIDAGGEGVLRSVWQLSRLYARGNDIDSIEWIVDAVNCAEPNLKLRRILTARGFEVRELSESEPVYWLKVEV